MPKYVIAPVKDIPAGTRKLIEIRGRNIVIFNLQGEFFCLLDRCPHQGGSLCRGQLVGLVEANEPGIYKFSRPNEIIRCPWHGWEFDIRSGKSTCNPEKIQATQYGIEIKKGTMIADGFYQVEKFKVEIEDDYVVVEV